MMIISDGALFTCGTAGTTRTLASCTSGGGRRGGEQEPSSEAPNMEKPEPDRSIG